MPLQLTPKQARKYLPKEEKPEKAAPKRKATARPSYTSLSEQGWQFATTGERAHLVYAWRMQGDRMLRTANYPAGVEDNLGSHYRPAVDAVARGDWTTMKEGTEPCTD